MKAPRAPGLALLTVSWHSPLAAESGINLTDIHDHCDYNHEEFTAAVICTTDISENQIDNFIPT